MAFIANMEYHRFNNRRRCAKFEDAWKSEDGRTRDQESERSVGEENSNLETLSYDKLNGKWKNSFSCSGLPKINLQLQHQKLRLQSPGPGRKRHLLPTNGQQREKCEPFFVSLCTHPMCACSPAQCASPIGLEPQRVNDTQWLPHEISYMNINVRNNFSKRLELNVSSRRFQILSSVPWNRLTWTNCWPGRRQHPGESSGFI